MTSENLPSKEFYGKFSRNLSFMSTFHSPSGAPYRAPPGVPGPERLRSTGSEVALCLPPAPPMAPEEGSAAVWSFPRNYEVLGFLWDFLGFL